MYKYFSFFIVFVVFFSAVGVYGASQQRNLMDKLLYSRDGSFGGLAGSSTNRSFFEHKIDSGSLESVKSVIGENLFRSLHLDIEEGKSVSDFIESNQAALREHPFVLAALVYDVTKSNNIPLSMVDDDDEEKIDLAAPARTISAKDLYENSQGPNGTPRTFRDFLSRNYGLSNESPVDRPDEISAMSVFFNYAASIKNGDSGGETDPDKLLSDRFVRDTGRGEPASPPAADAKGLFLPSSEALQTMQQLLAIHKELKYANTSGHSPDLSSIDRGILGSFMDKVGVSDVSELSSLSSNDLKAHLSSLVNSVVQNELTQNDYVAEVSSVAVGADQIGNNGNSVSNGLNANSSGMVEPSFVSGNNEATTAVNLTYSDALSPLKESQRTELEMENSGLFHINGNPEDLKEGAKLYHFLGTADISDGYLSLMERPRDSTE